MLLFLTEPEKVYVARMIRTNFISSEVAAVIEIVFAALMLIVDEIAILEVITILTFIAAAMVTVVVADTFIVIVAETVSAERILIGIVIVAAMFTTMLTSCF